MHPVLPENRRKAERRQLIDRRAPQPRRATVERRIGDRRAAPVRVPHERRSTLDRRVRVRRALGHRRTETRRLARRRRETASPFTAVQAAAIQRGYGVAGPRPTCPGCGGPFTLGRGRRRGADFVRLVRCLSCGRSTLVSNSRQLRVMVIAQESVRRALRAVLEAAGHDVVQAPNAAVGLWACEHHGADVVFVEAQSPGTLSAGEFMRQLRRADPEARVVAMAARRSYGVADPLAMARQLGATASLRMPFQRDDVLAALAQARG